MQRAANRQRVLIEHLSVSFGSQRQNPAAAPLLLRRGAAAHLSPSLPTACLLRRPQLLLKTEAPPCKRYRPRSNRAPQQAELTSAAAHRRTMWSLCLPAALPSAKRGGAAS